MVLPTENSEELQFPLFTLRPSCFDSRVLGGLFQSQAVPNLPPRSVAVGAGAIPLIMVRHPRARRYLLRLRPDGTARVTIPRRGSVGAAWEFVQRNLPWLEQQWLRCQSQCRKPALWPLGTEILLRGETVRLELNEAGLLCVGDQTLRPDPVDGDLRPQVERHLRNLATKELPARLLELASQQGLAIRRITIRNQRTRWGSCSRRGTVSLNWRLVQTPDFVRDYICLHELAHLLEMNHSDRFWRNVERMCPDYRAAGRWLKTHPGLLS